MAKFNNSLGIQNIGIYAATSSLVNPSGIKKSRNGTGQFKTTASIGSIKSGTMKI